MSLRDALQLSEFDGLTAQQSLDLLKTTVNFPEDHTAYTWSGLGIKLRSLIDVFPDLTFEIVASARTLVNGMTGGSMLDGCLVSGGWDFADASNRGALQMLMPTAPPGAVVLMNAMLFVGCPTGKKWKLHGMTQEPTLSEVTTELAAIATIATRSRIENAWTVVSNAVAGGTVTTFAQAVTLFGEQ